MVRLDVLKLASDVGHGREEQPAAFAREVLDRNVEDGEGRGDGLLQPPPNQVVVPGSFALLLPGVDGALGDDCLKGKTFVIAGCFPEVGGGPRGEEGAIGVENVKDMIASFGGRVVSDSQIADYLLVGQDAVASGFADATKREVGIISLRRLQGLLLGHVTFDLLESMPALTADMFAGQAYQAAGAPPPLPPSAPKASAAAKKVGEVTAGREEGKGKRYYNHERTLRSQRSQQRRLDNNAATKLCEHCGADDDCYKLRVCLGCNLALYCSVSCQKAASGSHRRICSIISELPPRGANGLLLRFDKDAHNDFDACLRYATKYMDDMKHLEIGLATMDKDDTVKLSAKQLSLLLRAKKGALNSFFWVQKDGNCIAGVSRNGYDVWRELRELKQLRLCNLRFDDAQHIGDIICQQRNTLMVLYLSYLDIDWSRAKCRRTIAQAANACTHLVKLDLRGGVLMDSDLKIMLHDLPNLRVLNLQRYEEYSHEFTDNTCGLIARKCPGLQELNLDDHNQLSVRGIRKIFEGCARLRAFHTTTRKLSCGDVRSLLEIAPQLLYLYLGDKTHISEDELSLVIEATGGRTVLQQSINSAVVPYGVSANTKEKYERHLDVLANIWSRRDDPNLANEWADIW